MEKLTVLVVDDDRNHREMLRALLEEWGYAPTGAASGEEAIAHALPGFLGEVLAWLFNTAVSTVIGVLAGAIVVAVMMVVHRFTHRAHRDEHQSEPDAAH